MKAQYLTATTAAASLGLSSRQLRSYITRGVLPARITPLGYLIRPADLERISADKRAGRGRPATPLNACPVGGVR